MIHPWATFIACVANLNGSEIAIAFGKEHSGRNMCLINSKTNNMYIAGYFSYIRVVSLAQAQAYNRLHASGAGAKDMVKMFGNNNMD